MLTRSLTTLGSSLEKSLKVLCAIEPAAKPCVIDASKLMVFRSAESESGWSVFLFGPLFSVSA